VFGGGRGFVAIRSQSASRKKQRETTIRKTLTVNPLGVTRAALSLTLNGSAGISAEMTLGDAWHAPPKCLFTGSPSVTSDGRLTILDFGLAKESASSTKPNDTTLLSSTHTSAAQSVTCLRSRCEGEPAIIAAIFSLSEPFYTRCSGINQLELGYAYGHANASIGYQVALLLKGGPALSLAQFEAVSIRTCAHRGVLVASA